MAVSSTTNARTPATEPDRLAYLCGRWVEHDALRIPVDDLGFRQAVTAVERLRTYAGAIFQLEAHLHRWYATLEQLRIGGVASPEAMVELNAELLRRNRRWQQAEGDVGITWFATPGNNAGGQATLGLHLSSIDHRRVERRRRHGQPLVVTDVVQPPPSSWPRWIKVRCRLHYYLADRAARERDAEAAGVLLDSDGSITETSIANIAVVLSGEIVSPPAARVLGGITQQVIEPLAESAGIGWRKSVVTADMLRRADEVLLMGTDTGLWFASSVDERFVAGGRPGEIYRELRERYDRAVGGGQDAAR